jgi:hypothetical protein
VNLHHDIARRQVIDGFGGDLPIVLTLTSLADNHGLKGYIAHSISPFLMIID